MTEEKKNIEQLLPLDLELETDSDTGILDELDEFVEYDLEGSEEELLVEDDEDDQYLEDIEDIEDNSDKKKKNIIKLKVMSTNVTPNRMTTYEFTRILGDRARHLDNGAHPYVDVSNMTSSIEIAYTEIIQRKLPMTITRGLGGKTVDILRIMEMDLPSIAPMRWIVPSH